jgi:hypothetical protein
MVSVDLEPICLQPGYRCLQQPGVLEHAAAERDGIESGTAAQAQADSRQDISQRGVEAGGDERSGHLTQKIFDDAADDVRRLDDDAVIAVTDHSRID